MRRYTLLVLLACTLPFFLVGAVHAQSVDPAAEMAKRLAIFEKSPSAAPYLQFIKRLPIYTPSSLKEAFGENSNTVRTNLSNGEAQKSVSVRNPLPKGAEALLVVITKENTASSNGAWARSMAEAFEPSGASTAVPTGDIGLLWFNPAGDWSEKLSTIRLIQYAYMVKNGSVNGRIDQQKMQLASKHVRLADITRECLQIIGAEKYTEYLGNRVVTAMQTTISEAKPNKAELDLIFSPLTDRERDWLYTWSEIDFRFTMFEVRMIEQKTTLLQSVLTFNAKEAPKDQ